jgi:hypothetical protein
MRPVKTQLELNVRSRGAMSGVLTMGSLDPAFDAAPRVDGGPVVLDLQTVEFVEPAGLCGLAALLEYLCAHCEEVNVSLAGRDVPAYLERMDFFRIFGDRVRTNADVGSLEERRRHNPGTLQELINFHTEEEIPGIIERISEILENQGYRLRERVAICSTLSEICANAAEHGVSSFGAYAAVQAYHHIISAEDALAQPRVRRTDQNRQRRPQARPRNGRLSDWRDRARRRPRPRRRDSRPLRRVPFPALRRRPRDRLRKP